MLSSVYTKLEEQAYAKMAKIGFTGDMVKLNREICMKFGHSVHMETIPVEKKEHTQRRILKKLIMIFWNITRKCGEGRVY